MSDKMENEKMMSTVSRVSDEALTEVTGGRGWYEEDNDETTYMQCSACDYKGTMQGMHVSQTFICPRCGQNSYTGQTMIPQSDWTND